MEGEGDPRHDAGDKAEIGAQNAKGQVRNAPRPGVLARPRATHLAVLHSSQSFRAPLLAFPPTEASVLSAHEGNRLGPTKEEGKGSTSTPPRPRPRVDVSRESTALQSTPIPCTRHGRSPAGALVALLAKVLLPSPHYPPSATAPPCSSTSKQKKLPPPRKKTPSPPPLRENIPQKKENTKKNSQPPLRPLHRIRVEPIAKRHPPVVPPRVALADAVELRCGAPVERALDVVCATGEGVSYHTNKGMVREYERGRRRKGRERGRGRGRGRGGRQSMKQA
jgi:hypothetical protein